MPECSRIPPICQQSALLNLKCAHGEQQPRTNQASICLHFFTLHFCSKKSHIPLLFRLPLCIFIAPFLFIFSCQPYLSSSLITPPALLPLSRPSWGAQYDGNGNALHGVCVCVMSHYNGSIVALSFLILVLTDQTAIFRFYKPFLKKL